MEHLLPKRLLLLIAVLAFAAAPAEAQRAPASSAPAASPTERITPGGRRSQARVEQGRASYYARSLHGRPTASGERYNHQALTAAHRTLPFGTILRVTNERTGRAVLVRVNDRGPFHRSRMLDLSGAAAERIGMVRTGTANVRVEVVQDSATTRRRL